MNNEKKRLDQILVEKKLVASRSKAQAMIMAGQIYVNDIKITKSGTSFNKNIDISIKKLRSEWVSRGALKLLKIIETSKIEIKNKICLDLGSSTGGFTQVLLKNDAKKIYSVDVGKNQLHEILKKEKKIISIEKCNAKFLDRNVIEDDIDIIVCDVSFISLKKVIKPCLKFLKNNSIIIALIKPQFEVEKKLLKKGIVTNTIIHKKICEEISMWFESNCSSEVLNLIQSPLLGPKGNKEFLIYCKYYKNLKQ